jgi:hypothetical protein
MLKMSNEMVTPSVMGVKLGIGRTQLLQALEGRRKPSKNVSQNNRQLQRDWNWTALE